MSVLTEVEAGIMRGHIPALTEEVVRIERKLAAYQSSITNRNHIMAVNRFINQAEEAAKKAAMVDGQLDRLSWDRVYHREMNRLTRAAELRV